MLRRIALENFKCWRELDIELAPITLLFGANSSGKTAILQSLLMLKQTAQGFDPGQHINFGGTDRDYVNLGSYQDVIGEHDTESKMGVRLTWDTSLSGHFIHRKGDGPLAWREFTFRSIEYDVVWGFHATVFVDKLRYDTKFVDAAAEWIDVRRESEGEYLWTSSSLPDPKEGRPIVSSPTRCYVLPWELSNLPLNAGSGSFPHLAKEFVRLFDYIEYLGPIRIRPERFYRWTGTELDRIEPDGANTIQSLITSSRSDEVLAEAVANGIIKLDLVEAFTIRTINENKGLYEITATSGGVESSLTDVGFGVSQVLPVLTMLLSAPANSIILLEQPELHLHPNAQAALADLMLYVAETRKLQLIVESHSEHIVRRLQRRIAEAQRPFATPENIKMYYCESGKTGSTVSEVEVDRFGQISNWPDRFMGDISGDLHSMLRAALERRSQELERVGSGS